MDNDAIDYIIDNRVKIERKVGRERYNEIMKIVISELYPNLNIKVDSVESIEDIYNYLTTKLKYE